MPEDCLRCDKYRESCDGNVFTDTLDCVIETIYYED